MSDDQQLELPFDPPITVDHYWLTGDVDEHGRLTCHRCGQLWEASCHKPSHGPRVLPK